MSPAQSLVSATTIVWAFVRIAWCLLTISLTLVIYRRTTAQEISAAPPAQLALPSERLMMEQARELSQAGEIDEALQLLEKLFDEAEQRLVVTGQQQSAATLKTQRYVPLAEWVRQRTRTLLEQFPDAASTLNSRHQPQATLALAQLQMSKDPIAALTLARRYGATEVGRPLQLLLCDLYLENGWGLAASQAAQLLSADARVELVGLESRAASNSSNPAQHDTAAGTLAAPYAWQQLSAKQPQQTPEQRDQLWQELFVNETTPSAIDQLIEVAKRLLIAAAMNPEALDGQATQAWSEQLAMHLPSTASAELKLLLSQIKSWSPQNDQLANPQEISFVEWPAWSRTLEKYSASSDRVAASKPRVAETERGTLPYFPTVQNGRVFVNELTQIVAYDLQTGESWPDSRTSLPLFDSHISSAAFLPLGYPMIGVPRGSLEILGESLYARLGSPITGRVNLRPNASGDSASYLIGLDLSRQASVLRGFPLHLTPPEFNNAEFDGPPVAWGEMLLVAVAERDHVGLRRGVAAFHRVSGQLLWKSGTLAAGAVPGAERANLLAYQQLTLAGGRLYYNTNLGSIACLDPLTGATQWLVQYSTPPDDKQFPKPNRYRYRDLTPCQLSAGLVYCAPQDAPEIFALDALTGELVWSTDDTAVADVVHLLGTHADSLLVSGDRLLWLDKRTGAIQGRFPASTTPIPAGALPSPRGLGRGVIQGNSIYWPTAGEILVFPASPPANSAWSDLPLMIARLPVQPGGSAGVNVILVDNTLLVASPSRLMAFPSRSQ